MNHYLSSHSFYSIDNLELAFCAIVQMLRAIANDHIVVIFALVIWDSPAFLFILTVGVVNEWEGKVIGLDI